MAEEWDLYAVVRSCTSATNTTAASSNPQNTNSGNENREEPLACLASLTFEEDDDLFSFPNLAQTRNNGSLQDSCKPFLPTSDPTTSSTKQDVDPRLSCSLPGRSNGQQHPHQRQQQQQQQHQRSVATTALSPPLTPASPPVFVFGQPRNQQPPQHLPLQLPQLQKNPSHQQQQPQLQRPLSVPLLRPVQTQAPRSRKRKNQQKRTVCHVTSDNLSTDPWAWRKYGQKPIKGSPYPRNYYRCSSSKGCSARKQVERSHLDPNIFIVTYTGDHTHPRPTHRNSLAGSTRNKLSTIQKSAGKDSPTETTADTSCSSPRAAPAGLSPTTPLPAPQESAPAPSVDPENGAGDEESDEMATEMMDGDSDDEDLLIPNRAIDEDLFKGLEGLATRDAGTSTGRGFGRSPGFGDNFSSWAAGSSSSAGTASGGG